MSSPGMGWQQSRKKYLPMCSSLIMHGFFLLKPSLTVTGSTVLSSSFFFFLSRPRNDTYLRQLEVEVLFLSFSLSLSMSFSPSRMVRSPMARNRSSCFCMS